MDIARAIYDDPLFAWQPRPPCKPAAPTGQAPCIDLAAPDSGPSVHSVCSVPSVDLPEEFRLIWAVLEQHRGAGAAITAPRIAEAAGLWPDQAPANRGTKVRHIIEVAQNAWPWPLCGDADGYYLAATAEEVSHYYANCTSRGKCIFHRRGSFRRSALRVGFRECGKGRFVDREEAPIRQ